MSDHQDEHLGSFCNLSDIARFYFAPVVRTFAEGTIPWADHMRREVFFFVAIAIGCFTIFLIAALAESRFAISAIQVQSNLIVFDIAEMTSQYAS